MRENIEYEFRDNPNSDFTILSQAITRDTELTMEAKALYTQICSLPKKNFIISIERLAAMFKKAGSDKRVGTATIRRALHELEDADYIRRKRNYDKKGHRTYDTYFIRRDPKGILKKDDEVYVFEDSDLEDEPF